MTSRALVLGRGLGTRMQSADPAAGLSAAQQRAADAGSKALMPIAGRPFLDYGVSSLADAGISQVGVVVAPEHQALSDHYAPNPPSPVALAFGVQAAAPRPADAG